VSPESILLPEPMFEGMLWRPPHKSDVPAIVALQDACCDVDRDERLVESEVLDWWADPSDDPAVDALLGFDASGDLVVSIWSLVPDGDRSTQRIHGYQNQVHPRVRSGTMYQFVLDWWEARGRQRMSEDRNPLPGKFVHYRVADQEDQIQFLTSHGYEIARYFHELNRDLSGPIDAVEIPDGITVRPFDDHRSQARLVHNDAFLDHWGSEPISAEKWELHLAEFFEPNASFVAFDGDDPVAYVLCATYPHDFGVRGWSHTWVEGAGTVRSHRRRGLASALITRAMRVMAEGGMEYAILGVDADSPTGAYGVYEALGFRELRREVALTKKV
jgi:GNAT superfamily N-acetyltransferase